MAKCIVNGSHLVSGRKKVPIQDGHHLVFPMFLLVWAGSNCLGLPQERRLWSSSSQLWGTSSVSMPCRFGCVSVSFEFPSCFMACTTLPNCFSLSLSRISDPLCLHLVDLMCHGYPHLSLFCWKICYYSLTTTTSMTTTTTISAYCYSCSSCCCW